jgi:hypothetical protein
MRDLKSEIIWSSPTLLRAQAPPGKRRIISIPLVLVEQTCNVRDEARWTMAPRRKYMIIGIWRGLRRHHSCSTRRRGDQYLGKHCRRIYRRSLGPDCATRRYFYARVLQPALHYELEQVSKIDILRKLKRRFGPKTIRDIRFRLG